jgi:hypothetical protein
MTTSDVDRLERFMDNRFDKLEERFEQMNTRVMLLERNIATLRVFAYLAASVVIIITAAGIIRGLQYLAS